MARKKPISQILFEISLLEEDAKVNVLKQAVEKYPQIQGIFKAAFDHTIEFRIPEGEPANLKVYEDDDNKDSRLYEMVKKFHVFFKNAETDEPLDDTPQAKAENLWIELLKSVADCDRQMLYFVKDLRTLPWPGLTRKHIDVVCKGLLPPEPKKSSKAAKK